MMTGMMQNPWRICCDNQEKFTSKTWRATLLLCQWEVGACWASWADALYMIDQWPTVVDTLNAEHPGICLGELCNAAGLLDRHGNVGRPDWNRIRVGIRPEG